jgi:hypothetical protein
VCWVLYLAADRPLPLKPFDPGTPAFNVAELSHHEAAVRIQFSKPFVYALGAHTGCGCGFDAEAANRDHPEELEASTASLEALRTYLEAALATAGALELYACWDGDQGSTPDQRRRVGLADVGPGMTWFPDRTFVELAGGAP